MQLVIPFLGYLSITPSDSNISGINFQKRSGSADRSHKLSVVWLASHATLTRGAHARLHLTLSFLLPPSNPLISPFLHPHLSFSLSIISPASWKPPPATSSRSHPPPAARALDFSHDVSLLLQQATIGVLHLLPPKKRCWPKLSMSSIKRCCEQGGGSKIATSRGMCDASSRTAVRRGLASVREVTYERHCDGGRLRGETCGMASWSCRCKLGAAATLLREEGRGAASKAGDCYKGC